MLAWRAQHLNITYSIMERVLVSVPPVALAHLGRLDPDRVEPGLVPQGHIEVGLMLLLQVLDRGQVQVVVVVVADHDDVDPGQFVQFARGWGHTFGPHVLGRAATVRKNGVKENVDAVDLHQKTRTKKENR